MNDILKRFTQFPTQFFLILIGVLLFFPFLGNVHLLDWDEINFAESAREMLVTGNYRMMQIDFQPFYEKPPLFIWLQMFSMKYFGVSEVAARFPSAVFGILTMLNVFNAGRKYFNSSFGVWWALLFAGSLLPHIYFKSGLIDPVFNYFIFLSLYFLFNISIKDDFEDRKTRRTNHRWYLIASALVAGLAVLTKGPVALLLIVLVVSIVLVINRGKLNFNFSDLFIWLLVVVLVIGSWLSVEIKQNGFAFIQEFVKYQIRLFSTQDAGHGGPFYYHFIILLIGCFPASILGLESFRRNYDDTFHQLSFKRWMFVLLAVVLILFSVVQTKIINYSTLCYFPITFLGAYYIHHLIAGRWRWTWRQTTGILLIGGALCTAAALIPWAGLHLQIAKPYLKDDFAKEALNAKVYWNLKEAAFGIVGLVCIVISLILIYSKKTLLGLYVLVLSFCLMINILLSQFMPRIEKYSQNAMIEFLEQKQVEDCYIVVYGFKSYAQLFYGAKKQPLTPQDRDENYMLNGPVTKPVYVITKVTRINSFTAADHFEELYRRNGFVFLKRK